MKQSTKSVYSDYRKLSWLAVLALMVSAPLSSLAQDWMTDANIALAVENELALSNLTPADKISVSVSKGVVSMSGDVETLAARRQAEDIAAAVNGVQGIVNGIKVDVKSMLPDKLHADIVNALTNDPATDRYEIDIDVRPGGGVTLSGTVNSWAEKTLAGNVVSTVAGVSSIDNRLGVDTSRTYRGSEEIDADITERLRWNARVDASDISVLVRDGGRVTMSGTVGSLAEKRLAVDLAHVAGVHAVDASHLEVAPG